MGDHCHLHAVRGPPSLGNARHQPQHRYSTSLDELSKELPQGEPLKQGCCGPIQKGSEHSRITEVQVSQEEQLSPSCSQRPSKLWQC